MGESWFRDGNSPGTLALPYVQRKSVWLENCEHEVDRWSLSGPILHNGQQSETPYHRHSEVDLPTEGAGA